MNSIEKIIDSMIEKMITNLEPRKYEFNSEEENLKVPFYFAHNLRKISYLIGQNAFLKVLGDNVGMRKKQLSQAVLTLILEKIGEPKLMSKFWFFDIDKMEMVLQFEEETPVMKISLSGDRPVYEYDNWDYWENFWVERSHQLPDLPKDIFSSKEEFLSYTKNFLSRFRRAFPEWQKSSCASDTSCFPPDSYMMIYNDWNTFKEKYLH